MPSSSSPSSSANRRAAMSRLPPLLPTPPSSHKLRGADAVESGAPKRCPVEPPRPTSGSRSRHVSLYSASSRRRERSPSPSSSRHRAGRPASSRNHSEPSPPPYKVRRRSRSPPRRSITQRLAELHHAKRPRRREAVVDDRKEGEIAGSSRCDESAKRPNHSHYHYKHPEASLAAAEERLDPEIRSGVQKLDNEKMEGKNHNYHKHPETSSATVERLDPANRGDGQKFDDEKMEGKNQSDCKTQSRSARRKKIKRQFRSTEKNELTEMKKEKLLQKIKKLQACIWLLEKEGAGRPEIMEIRSLLESAEQQYAEKEAQSAKEGSSASHEGLNKNKHEEMVGDEIIVNMLKAVSKQNELTEEVNHLKSELQVVKQDRDYQLAQVQSLMADIGKQKEMTRRCGVELENAMGRVSALEEGCLLQRETIRALQLQLASANEKLKVSSSSSTEDRC